MIASITLALLLSAGQAEEPTAAPAPEPAQASQHPEEEICRRKMRPDPRLANRLRSVKVCKTRQEWGRTTAGST